MFDANDEDFSVEQKASLAAYFLFARIQEQLKEQGVWEEEDEEEEEEEGSFIHYCQYCHQNTLYSQQPFFLEPWVRCMAKGCPGQGEPNAED